MSVYVVGQLRKVLENPERYPLDLWGAMSEKLEKYLYYAQGDVFQALADPENPESTFRYPLKFNLVASFCEKAAAHLFGQWEGQIVRFAAQPLKKNHEEPSAEARRIAKVLTDDLSDIWLDNDMNTLLAEAAMNGQVLGGVWLRAHRNILADRDIVQALLPTAVFPVMSAESYMEPSEVIIAYPIDREEAMARYGIQLPNTYDHLVLYHEHWTPSTFALYIDKTLVDRKPNPYGVIPLEYFPRYRFGGDFYGRALTEGILGLQDEINLRLADIGDGINYNMHPIKALTNFKGRLDDLPNGPDAVWDLGQSLGNSEPKAQILEGHGNYPQAMDFVNALLELAQDVGHLPAISFGRDEGSQRSGMTLHIRFMPLTQIMQWTRLYWGSAFAKFNRKLAWIHYSSEGDGRFAQASQQHRWETQWFELLPKDEELQMQRQIELVQAALQSPVKALMFLHKISEGEAEELWNVIQVQLKELAQIKAMEKPKPENAPASGKPKAE